MKLVLGAAPPPGITVEIAPLSPLPDDLRAWISAAMTRELAPGATVAQTAEREARTATGWPMRIAFADVRVGGEVVERRVGGFYEMNEWAGLVLVRIPIDVILPDEEISGVLASAHPMWRSRTVIAALAELWS